MTVLVILAMLAVMAVPTLENLFTHSEQTARNHVARTIFMAAQSALTTKYGQDARYADSLAGLDTVPLERVSPALTEEINLGNNGKDRYIALSRGGTSILKNLLGPYMNDKEVLNNVILIEFNQETGNVLSAFYTEDPDIISLGYDSGSLITERAPAYLEKARIGYYGVATTGKKVTPEELGDVAVHLADYDDDPSLASGAGYVDYFPDGKALNVNEGKNYGLLTAECMLPVPLSEMAAEKYTCRLTLEPQAGSPETVTVSWNPFNAAADYQSGDIPNGNDSLEKAMAMDADARGRTIPVFTESRGGVDYLVFVLDSVTERASLHQNFPGIGCGFLTATFVVTDGMNESSAYSNTRHAFFGGKVKNAAVDTLAVTSIRHLNNIRYNLAGNYAQMQPLTGNDYKGGLLTGLTPIGTGNEPFTGGYDGGGKEVTRVSIKGVRAALFDTIGDTGRVEKLYLKEDCSFSAESQDPDAHAAAVACDNKGTVTRCESRAAVTAATDGGIAGGLVAENSGTVSLSYVGANILGSSIAGGIAGTSEGRVWYCEAGTLTSGTEITAQFHGAPYFGARGGSIENYRDVNDDPYTFDNDVFFVKAIASQGAGGGIVAELTEGGSVRYCTNAAKVNDSLQNKQDAPAFAGGIVARAEHNTVDNAVAFNYNAGSVFGAGPTGGIAGYLDCEMFACYNVARVNAQQDKNAAINELLKSRRTYLLGNVNNMGEHPEQAHPSGGIVGYAASTAKVYDCYSAHYVGAKYGGGFGIMHEDAVYAGCHFQKNYYNTSNLFYVSDNDDYTTGDLIAEGRTPAYYKQSSADMRIMAGWNASAVTSQFQAIVNNAAVGVQNFCLPYLDFSKIANADAAVSGLGASYHRTPWDRPVEEIGSISLKNGDNPGEIYATIRVLAGSATSSYTGEVNVSLTTDVQGAGAQRVKLIIDMKTELDLAARNAGGGWSGWSARHGDDATGNQGHTYQYRARTATADEKLLGYDYAYQVKFFWDRPGSGNSYQDFLPDGATRVTATLYERDKATFENGMEYDHATLERAIGGLTFIEDYPLTSLTANVLQIDIVNPLDNGTHHLSVSYMGSGRTFNNCITLSKAAIDYANDHEGDYWAVYSSGPRISVQAGAASNGTTLLYKKDGKYYLILYRDGLLYSDFKRPNGFLTGDPFVITMKYKGKDYSTAPQTFTVPAP